MDVDARVSIIGTDHSLSDDNHQESIITETKNTDTNSTNNQLLHHVKCLVETFNEDEIDTSTETENSLTSLGATISNSLGEHLTHYITSYPTLLSTNKKHKRILVAEMLGIPVVSPTWVRDCKEQQQQLPIQPYVIKGILYPSMRKPAAGELFYSANKGKESAARIVTDQDGISPTKMENSASLSEQCTDSTRMPERPRTVSVGLSLSRSISGVEVSQTAAGILLPSFREITPPVVPAEVLEKVQKRRRSERICDLGEDDSDSDLFAPVSKHSRTAGESSWEVIEKIPVSTELPVFYEQGREGDVLEISTVFPSSASEWKRSSGSGCSSGIQGLTVRGTREGPGSRLRSGRQEEPTSRHPKAVNAIAVRSDKKLRHQAAAKCVAAQVVLALTGFSDKAGERSTLLQLLREFIQTPKKTSPPCGPSDEQTAVDVGLSESHIQAAANTYAADGTSVSASSLSVASCTQDGESETGRKKRYGRPRKSDPGAVLADTPSNDEPSDPTQAWQVAPLTSSVAVLPDPNDYSAGACTHVIANSKAPSRTLRTLFALARGQCVMTEAWVYQSVSQESWADVRAFLHPRYSQRPHRVDVFKGKKICVLDSVNPPRDVLLDLVQAAGGRVTRDITEAGVALVVFGDLCAANEWIAGKLRKRKPSTHREVAECKTFARKRKIVTCKHIFNCIEEGEMSAPPPDSPDLVRPEHLLVFNCPDLKVEEHMQRLRGWEPLAPKVAARQVRIAKIAQKQVTVDREFWIEGGAGSRKTSASAAWQSADVPRKVTRSTAAVADIPSVHPQSPIPAVRARRTGRQDSASLEQLPGSLLTDAAETAPPSSGLRLKARLQTADATAAPNKGRLGAKRAPLRNAMKQQTADPDLVPESETAADADLVPETTTDPDLVPESETAADADLVPETTTDPGLVPESETAADADLVPETETTAEDKVRLEEAHCEDASDTQPPTAGVDVCAMETEERTEECAPAAPTDAVLPDADRGESDRADRNSTVADIEIQSTATIYTPEPTVPAASPPSTSLACSELAVVSCGLETSDQQPPSESVSAAAEGPCVAGVAATDCTKDFCVVKRTVSTLEVASSLVELSFKACSTSRVGSMLPEVRTATSSIYDHNTFPATAAASVSPLTALSTNKDLPCSHPTATAPPDPAVSVAAPIVPVPVHPVSAASVPALATPVLAALPRSDPEPGVPAHSPPASSAPAVSVPVSTASTRVVMWNNNMPHVLRGLISDPAPQQTAEQIAQQIEQQRQQKEQEQQESAQQWLQKLQQGHTQLPSAGEKRKIDEFVDPYEHYDAAKTVAQGTSRTTITSGSSTNYSSSSSNIHHKPQQRDEQQIQVGCARRSVDVLDSMALLDSRVGGRLLAKPTVRASYPLSSSSSSGSRSNGNKGTHVVGTMRQHESIKTPVPAAPVHTGIAYQPKQPIKITNRHPDAYLQQQSRAQSSGPSTSPRTLAGSSLSSPRPRSYSNGKSASRNTASSASRTPPAQSTAIAPPQSRLVYKQ